MLLVLLRSCTRRQRPLLKFCACACSQGPVLKLCACVSKGLHCNSVRTRALQLCACAFKGLHCISLRAVPAACAHCLRPLPACVQCPLPVGVELACVGRGFAVLRCEGLYEAKVTLVPALPVPLDSRPPSPKGGLGGVASGCKDSGQSGAVHVGRAGPACASRLAAAVAQGRFGCGKGKQKGEALWLKV